jgi:hypothetical protein
VIAKLDQRFPSLEHTHDHGPGCVDQSAETPIRGITARHQDDLRRGAAPADQSNEVVVLGHHHRTSVTGRQEYFIVLRRAAG